MQTINNAKIKLTNRNNWIDCIPKEPDDTSHTLDFDERGSLYKLEEVINQNKIDIDVMGIMSSLSKYVKRLEPNEENVFKSFYWRQMSVSDIRKLYCFKSNNSVFELLSQSTDKYITILKQNFGIKA